MSPTAWITEAACGYQHHPDSENAAIIFTNIPPSFSLISQIIVTGTFLLPGIKQGQPWPAFFQRYESGTHGLWTEWAKWCWPRQAQPRAPGLMPAHRAGAQQEAWAGLRERGHTPQVAAAPSWGRQHRGWPTPCPWHSSLTALPHASLCHRSV